MLSYENFTNEIFKNVYFAKHKVLRVSKKHTNEFSLKDRNQILRVNKLYWKNITPFHTETLFYFNVHGKKKKKKITSCMVMKEVHIIGHLAIGVRTYIK